jgi:hypothetical protein
MRKQHLLFKEMNTKNLPMQPTIPTVIKNGCHEKGDRHFPLGLVAAK